MKAQELRIGNLIQIELGEREIAKVEELTLETGESNNQYYFLETNLLSNNSKWVDPIDFFEPIPLTEEWLLKFGFTKKRNLRGNKIDISAFSWFINNQEFLELKKYHCGDYDEGQTFYPTINYCDTNLVINYVHQLQNVYFALRNQELTIKE